MNIRNTLAFAVASAFVALAACSSSSTTTSNPSDAGASDAGAPKDGATGGDSATASACGHPGDKGNELGVGKYCDTVPECSDNTKATVCAVLGAPDEHFCTFLCDKDGGANQCGTDALCECQGGQCGCVPRSCVGD